MNTKNILITAAAGATIVAGAWVVSPKKMDSKPGYQVEQVTDGKYNVYTLKNGKKTIMGKDLSPDQADQFLNKQIGRHK